MAYPLSYIKYAVDTYIAFLRLYYNSYVNAAEHIPDLYYICLYCLILCITVGARGVEARLRIGARLHVGARFISPLFHSPLPRVGYQARLRRLLCLSK